MSPEAAAIANGYRSRCDRGWRMGEREWWWWCRGRGGVLELARVSECPRRGDLQAIVYRERSGRQEAATGESRGR